MGRYTHLFDLSGRRALVIGAGSGIGRAAAHGLASFGAEVVCADVREEAAAETAAMIAADGGVASAQKVDLRSADEVEALIAALPSLDILVTTPSINVRKPMVEITEEEFERVVGLNLRGTFLALRAAG
ncbi:MAG: 3-oxoacyl-ACP reductase, partial [Candidatus Thermofonsia Clade 3 bacterium]